MHKKIGEVFKNVDMRQFLKFIFVGVVNTGVFYGIYYGMLQLGISYVISLTVGNVIAIVNSYLWNKFFTFKSEKRSMNEMFKFFTIAILQYFLNLLIVHLGVTLVDISPELAGLLAIGVTVFVSYFGHKFWSFR